MCRYTLPLVTVYVTMSSRICCYCFQDTLTVIRSGLVLLVLPWVYISIVSASAKGMNVIHMLATLVADIFSPMLCRARGGWAVNQAITATSVFYSMIDELQGRMQYAKSDANDKTRMEAAMWTSQISYWIRRRH